VVKLTNKLSSDAAAHLTVRERMLRRKRHRLGSRWHPERYDHRHDGDGLFWMAGTIGRIYDAFFQETTSF
jgi:hypothetical protein